MAGRKPLPTHGMNSPPDAAFARAHRLGYDKRRLTANRRLSI